MGGTRSAHSFRFPYDKYEDEIALYANFKYLQEFLRNLSANSMHAYEKIIKPSDSTSTHAADVVLDGTDDNEVFEDLSSDGVGSFFVLDGTVKLDGEIRVSGDILIAGSGMDNTTFLDRTALGSSFSFVRPDSNVGSIVITISDLTMDGQNHNDTAVLTSLLGSSAALRAYNCRLKDFTQRNLYLTGSQAVQEHLVHGCLISGNTNGAGVEISDNHNAIISNCVISGNAGAGIFTGGASQVIIVGNKIVSNTGQSVDATGGSDTTLVVGNIISGNGTDTPDGTVVGLNSVGGAGVLGNINDLGDVTISSVASGELLQWNGSAWINRTLAEAGVAADPHTHTESDITDLDHPHELTDLSDVNTSTPTNRNVLVADGVDFESRALVEADISDLDHDDADAIHDNVSGEINAITEKASPVSADLLLIEDSAASNAKKKVQVGNLPGGTSDHGSLTGLDDDDHSFYPKGALGYAEVTSSQLEITSETDLTGMTKTVDVAASRRIKIVVGVNLRGTTQDDRLIIRIYEDGTSQLAGPAAFVSNANQNFYLTAFASTTPSEGEHTYKVTLQRINGTGDAELRASSDVPAFILVEDIGPA